MPLTLLLNGSRGRMGQAVSAVAAELGFRVGAAVDVGDQPAAGIENCDVIVDFSTPSATAELLRLAVSNRKPIVIGTTGHAAAEKRRLLAVAGKVPCVWSGNFSVGVNLLFYLTQRAAHILDAAYDAEVVEMHHRFKKDAPSGTATRLLEIILQERKLTADALRHGRNGITGERSAREVGVHSLRGGDVVGDHTVIFAALGERLELTHKTSDRAILARGALRAAQWVVSQPAGVYDMQDVLGLRD
jgi:4-hydroxy-tetrahydrodipicolinate reductase